MSLVDECMVLIERMTDAERSDLMRRAAALLPKHPMETRLMISAQGMLEALERSGDLTIRMIRGVFAEAAFAKEVLPTLNGWRALQIQGDQSYDFHLTDRPDSEIAARAKAVSAIRIQVKMQRSEKGQPLLAADVLKSRVSWPATHFVVELQKSRKGEKAGASTRPYRFGEFDVVAVSLGPSRGRWSEFVYTVANWLLPDPYDTTKIFTYQPVAPHDDEYWTSDFNQVAEWFRSGEVKRIAQAIPQVPLPARRQPKKTGRKR